LTGRVARHRAGRALVGTFVGPSGLAASKDETDVALPHGSRGTCHISGGAILFDGRDVRESAGPIIANNQEEKKKMRVFSGLRFCLFPATMTRCGQRRLWFLGKNYWRAASGCRSPQREPRKRRFHIEAVCIWWNSINMHTGLAATNRSGGGKQQRGSPRRRAQF